MYDFKREDAERFAAFVNIPAKVKGDELTFRTCPICRASDRDTFSISLKTGQCECKRASCGYKGNMLTLAREFDGFDLDKNTMAYHNIRGYNDRFKTFKAYKPKIEVKAIEYMKSRGISEEVTTKYGITMKKGESDALVFPFTTEKGDLKFIKYRNTKYVKGESYGSKEWCEKDCMPILFGMEQCDPEVRELVITEGQIDSLSLAEAGIRNAISVPTGKNGFTWVPHCWDFIQNYDTLIIFGDKEGDTMTLLDDFKRLFYRKAIKHVRLEDYKDCKDANEILQKYGKEQLKNCVKNAVPIPVKGLVDIADIKPINRYELEKLPTGIKILDSYLCGGLPFGGVADITGKTGEGKSTLASWIIAQAIDKGYKSFVYSGEMDKALFKEGLDRQICGDRVREDKGQDFVRYYISDEDQAEINAWYKGRCYFYDIYSLAIEDAESESANLTYKIEECATQHGMKVFLLDNLMTAMDQERIDGIDKYEKQSKFMKRLVSLAVRYQILIILVAHNRKDSTGTQNDNISGTADIGNLATVTIDYTKAPAPIKAGKNEQKYKAEDGFEVEEGKRILRLGKNRYFSKLALKGWQTEYDDKSNRIYIHSGSGSELKKDFKWHKPVFEPVIDDLEIPF